MSKCIVFGGSGFIGRHLVVSLLESGEDVTVFARSKNEDDLLAHPRLSYFMGDFFNAHDINEALKGQEYVFHLVSLTNPALSEDDPRIDLDTNVRMSIQLFESCVTNNIKKIIFTSSGGAIYGQNGKDSLSEDDPTFPISPYAIGKQAIEGYLRYFNKKHNLDYVIYRVANVYGSGQNTQNNKHGVISVFLNNILNKIPLNIYGDGGMTRDYVYVKDLTSFMSVKFKDDTSFKLYNIGSGSGLTINEIVGAIENATGIKAEVIFTAAPSSYVDKIVLDCSRAKNEFGEISTTSIDQGIRLMLKK